MPEMPCVLLQVSPMHAHPSADYASDWVPEAETPPSSRSGCFKLDFDVRSPCNSFWSMPSFSTSLPIMIFTSHISRSSLASSQPCMQLGSNLSDLGLTAPYHSQAALNGLFSSNMSSPSSRSIWPGSKLLRTLPMILLASCTLLSANHQKTVSCMEDPKQGQLD